MPEMEAMDPALLDKLLKPGLPWHERAVAMRALQKQGFTPEQVSSRTHIDTVTLHRYLIALTVWESLRKLPVEEALLQDFAQGRLERLYHLRELTLEWRGPAARYMWQKRLDPLAARELVQALHDYQRNAAAARAAGFGPEPGNALAYRRWTHAQREKNPRQRDRLLREAIVCAQSEDLRQKLWAELKQRHETSG